MNWCRTDTSRKMRTELYVTIHDQELIAKCEAAGQFAAFPDRTYLFVGRRPVDSFAADIIDGKRVKIVVARDHRPNFEHLPQFYDFTGWWVLAHHGLVEADRMVCLQYDMHVIDPDILVKCEQLIDGSPGIVAMNAGYFGPNWMLRLPGFEETYRRGLKTQEIHPEHFPPFDAWPSTQGTAWRRDVFYDFMRWFTPMFDVFKDHIFAGHLAERTVKAYSVVNTPEQYLLGVMAHEAADLHGTGALMAGRVDEYQRRNAAFGVAPDA